ncbi:hypothetical protein GOHSU_31_00310 [Gordonia hirsuta DSM 44140 = NBRC 16056]|uniref:Uncharacterized protein n=1 Tax=Gordonia hirsuta DSM 44140 = NBRC 16056 TaxID=1121927 RepID=L7LAK2_9ACTN|nr:hypothetical protein [Gordonia hirsuta]GAC58170.1 hypothetical protein GOHSU_31_00310 [Gordonia hirsuta DSM 44140 = NBRC 16056]
MTESPQPDDQSGSGRTSGGSAAAELPQSLRTAIRLMYVGAVLQVAVGVTFFLFVSRLRDDPRVRETYTDYVAEHGGDAQQLIDESVTSWRIGVAAVTVVLTALWLLLAWACRQGKRWGRPTSTGLGILAIIGSVYTLLGGIEPVAIATLVLAAAILYLLYRPDSTAYFNVVAAR